MRLLGLVLATVLIASVKAIYISVGSLPICYLVKLHDQEQCKISFQVSGQNEDDFIVQIKEEQSQAVVQEIKNKRDGVIQIQAKEEFQSMQICFRAPDGIPKYVSFEVLKTHYSKADQEYLSQDNIIKTERYFRDAEDELQTLYTNFRHSAIRERSHRDIMKSTEQKINICSIVKMLVVLIVFTLQIVLVTNTFKDKEQNGQPAFSMI